MKKLLLFAIVLVIAAGTAFSQTDQGITVVNIARDAQVTKIAQPEDIWITATQTTWKALNYWEFRVDGEPTAVIGYQLQLFETPGGPQYLNIRNRTLQTKSAVGNEYAPQSWSATGGGQNSNGTATLSGTTPGGTAAGTFFFKIGCEVRVMTGYTGGQTTSVTGVCNITTYSM